MGDERWAMHLVAAALLKLATRVRGAVVLERDAAVFDL
jgi:hypothetical protein